MNILPSIDRKEWRQLLTGEIDIPLKNFFFQMKVTQAKNLISSKVVTIEDAIPDIYKLCQKFYKAKNMSIDIQNIFKTNNEFIGTTTYPVVESPIKVEPQSTITHSLAADAVESENSIISNKIEINNTDLKQELLIEFKKELQKSNNLKNSEIEQIRSEIHRINNRKNEEIFELKNDIKKINDKFDIIENLNKNLINTVDGILMEEHKKGSSFFNFFTQIFK